MKKSYEEFTKIGCQYLPRRWEDYKTKQRKGKKKQKKKSRFLGAFVLFFFLTCFTFLGNHLRLSDDIFTLRENNNGIYTKTVSVNLFHPKVEHW